jgi:hypothetical protein
VSIKEIRHGRPLSLVLLLLVEISSLLLSGLLSEL